MGRRPGVITKINEQIKAMDSNIRRMLPQFAEIENVISPNQGKIIAEYNYYQGKRAAFTSVLHWYKEQTKKA